MMEKRNDSSTNKKKCLLSFKKVSLEQTDAAVVQMKKWVRNRKYKAVKWDVKLEVERQRKKIKMTRVKRKKSWFKKNHWVYKLKKWVMNEMHQAVSRDFKLEVEMEIKIMRVKMNSLTWPQIEQCNVLGGGKKTRETKEWWTRRNGTPSETLYRRWRGR